MKKVYHYILALLVITTSCVISCGVAFAELPDIALTAIDGHSTNLKKYHGKVIMVVNTATKCGYTPQLKELQELYKSNEARGFVVLGFPSNDFGGQAPESNSEINAFCSNKYKVTFPMFEKAPVSGPNKQPLFCLASLRMDKSGN